MYKNLMKQIKQKQIKQKQIKQKQIQQIFYTIFVSDCLSEKHFNFTKIVFRISKLSETI